MAERVRAHAEGRRHPRGARLRDRGSARARSRQEPAGGARRGAGVRGLLQRLRGRLRGAQGLRVRAAERPVDRLHFTQQERDAALWRLGRDRAVQLPHRAGCGPHGGGARHRQHRRAQVRFGHPLGGTPPRGLHTRCGRCRRASSITSTARAPRSASSSCAIRARPARPSRDLSRSAARSWRKWRQAVIRGHTSPRWAARIRPSSRRMPTSTARPRASRAPPTAWAGRSARRSRGSTSTRKSRTR